MLPLADTTRALAAAIALIAAVGVGLSLSLPLLSIEQERMGISGAANGLNSALAGLASIIAAPFVPSLALRFGVGALIAAAIALASLTLVAFKVTMNYWAWIPLRVLYSIGLGTLFIVSEFWISHAAPPERRGVVMGIYATVLSLGFFAGPTLLALVGTIGWTPYLAGLALFLLATLPLLAARDLLPRLDDQPSPPLLRYLAAAPLAAAAGCASGAIETGAIGMLPVLGIRLGQEAAAAALLVSAVALGNVVTQIPIGFLSDRIDRRVLLAVIALLVMVSSVGIALVSGAAGPSLFIILALWGGFTGAFYTVGLAHLASRFAPADLVGANAAFIIMFNVGQLAGPPLIGAGIDHSLRYGFAVITSAFALLVLLVAVRELNRRS